MRMPNVSRSQFHSSLIFLAIGLMFAAAFGYGQVLYGTLTGTVTDASGAPVPSAKVAAVDVGTGVAKQTTTDDRGNYIFTDLTPGTYKVTISAPSFRTVVEEGARLDANIVRRLDTQLQVSSVEQTLTVAAEAVALQTDRADVSQQLQSQQLSDLPEAGTRNFQSVF